MAADLVSKSLLWQYLAGPPERGGRVVPVLFGWFRLVASRNFGIVFGINFAAWFDLGPGAGQALTACLTLATAGLIVYVFAASGRTSRATHVWCGLILAGAAGNLYDRLVFGYVRDVIQFTAEVGGRPVWPFVFNAADVFLVAGVACLALTILLSPADGRGQDGRADDEDPSRDRARA